jgi:hypothetical protein
MASASSTASGEPKARLDQLYTCQKKVPQGDPTDLRKTPPVSAGLLFTLGFLTLFMELALIRYLAVSIWYLDYFPNLVLLGVFAGMGSGFISHRAIGETLSRRGIPELYRWAMAALSLSVVLLLFLTRRHPRRREAAADAPWQTKGAFLLMGTAFLLLETKSLIQFSLLFGTTWLNNSLVFLAVLVSVLLANACAALMRGPWLIRASTILLILFLGAALVFPISSLHLVSSLTARYLLASAFIFAPPLFGQSHLQHDLRQPERCRHPFGLEFLGRDRRRGA